MQPAAQCPEGMEENKTSAQAGEEGRKLGPSELKTPHRDITEVNGNDQAVLRY